MAERQTNRPTPVPEQTQPRQGRAEGRASLQGPTTVDRSEQLQASRVLSINPQEHSKLPPESTLSRAVERTRDLYERNDWVFLPLGAAGKPSSNLSGLQTEQPSQSEEVRRKKEENDRISNLPRLPTGLTCELPALPDDLIDELNKE